MGRARHTANADVHGRLRESRFDVPPTVPPDPRPDDPARYDDLPPNVRADLAAWIVQRVASDPEPLVNDLQLKAAFYADTGHSVPIGAIRGAMYAAGHLTPFRDLTGHRYRFRARLI